MTAPLAPAAPKPKIARKLWKPLLSLMLALLVGLLLCEGLLRYSLHSDSALANRIGETTRNPGLFGAPKLNDQYWILSHNFSNKRRVISGVDPIVGWRGSARILKGSYGHIDERSIGNKRPILMFGDSYTSCAIPSDQCWEGLMAKGPLADEDKLLNYGVGGYGLDQIYLLLREGLRHWDARTTGQKPLVIVAIMFDDDLDRVTLSVRDWPKPHFDLEDDELVYVPPVPPKKGTSIAAHLEPDITSYLWRYLVFGTSLFPPSLRKDLMGIPKITKKKRDLSKRLIQEIQSELTSRDLDYFYVLFPGTVTLGAGPDAPPGWPERLLTETLAEHNAPYVNARYDLFADIKLTKRPSRAYFGREGREKGHYTARSNQVAMRAIYRGLAGNFDTAD